MARRDTNDNRYNRQVPNRAQIVFVQVDTVDGVVVESFCIDDKADIIAHKNGKNGGRYVADWGACKHNDMHARTINGDTMEKVLRDMSDRVSRTVKVWYLRAAIKRFKQVRREGGLG
jgi:hypothetical protein